MGLQGTPVAALRLQSEGRGWQTRHLSRDPRGRAAHPLSSRAGCRTRGMKYEVCQYSMKGDIAWNCSSSNWCEKRKRRRDIRASGSASIGNDSTPTMRISAPRPVAAIAADWRRSCRMRRRSPAIRCGWCGRCAASMSACMHYGGQFIAYATEYRDGSPHCVVIAWLRCRRAGDGNARGTEPAAVVSVIPAHHHPRRAEA